MSDPSNDTLKESLGLLASESNEFADFAIDSDDEVDLSMPSQKGATSQELPIEDPVPSSNPAINLGSTQLKKKLVPANDDPLSAVFKSQPTSNNRAPSNTSNKPTSFPPQIASASGIFDNNNVKQTMYASNTPSMTGVTVTQSLSSTFSTFATKFQDVVTSATRTSPTQNMGNVATTSFENQQHRVIPNNVIPNNVLNNNTSANYVERSAGHYNAGLSTAPVVSSYNNGTNANTTVYNKNKVVEKPKQNQIYQVGSSTNIHDLDSSMKSSLVTSAIGELLPGERVIVFLSRLLQVRDSSSPQTGLGSSTFHSSSGKNDLVWCCIVTFYRLVVFSYHESEFDGSTTTDNNIGQRDSASNEMMNWMATSSVSRQYQHAYLSRVRQSGKTHDVLQMPLASVDRIEKSADFGLNTSSALSAVNLIGSNSAVSSGYKDGIGGAVASGTLVVYGKDNGRFIQFTTPSYADSMRVYESLNTYAFPGRRNLGYLFAFESRRAEVMASTNMKETDKQQFGKNGSLRINARASPKRYDAIMEFNRMVSSSDNIRCPWVPILRSNSTYNLCASYPSILFAPNSVDDGKPEGIRLLRDTAAFRSGGRYQTLSWASRFDGASLWRSAQPKVGLQGNRSPADELFMKKIAESAAFANSQAAVNGRIPARPTIAFLKMLTGGINETDMMLDSFASTDSPAFNEKCMLKIFDLRPKSSAMANRTAGYGYENTSHYKNTTLSFFGIGNIHAVRDSYRKISALCASPATNDVQWMQLVEDTKWLSMIRLILSSSWQAAFHIRYNRLPVLVHCSHGWDRTSQVCALTQILLDPYYRTRSGFSCLVEKDFLSLGHPFHTRLGHGEGKGGDLNGSGSSGGQSDEMSPIFLQFLDCVFQIVNQYPDYFEFNTKYLLLISEHIYSCRFGTLLCDTEREREVVASIRQRTYCLWEYLESCPGLSNDNYCCSDILSDADIIEGKGCLLMPLSSLLRNVTLWVDRHCMHGAKPTLRSLSLQSYEDTKSVQETNEQPLHGFNDFRESSLVKEVAQLKGCIASKDEEISILRAQLKEATTKV